MAAGEEEIGGPRKAEERIDWMANREENPGDDCLSQGKMVEGKKRLPFDR